MKHEHFESEPAPGEAAIDEAAADWLARHVRGLTPREEAQFERWRRADPRHAATWADLRDTWQTLDRLSEVRLPDGRPLDHDLPSTALAADTGPARRRSSGNLAFLAVGLAAAAMIALVFTLRPTSPEAPQTVATQTGGFEKLTLPDGSVIRLNTDSEVDVSFSPAERSINLLRGETSFEVAKDATRPFVVRAGGVAVRAVGTAFNVRLQAAAVDVLVTEGRVRVDDATQGSSLLSGVVRAPATPTGPLGDAPVLVAGQRATIQRKPETAAPEVMVKAVTVAEIARELAWQERKLEFLDTPLREVVAEFNRYNRHKVVIADPRLNERRFGGSIRADNGEAFVRLLESRFGVRVERGASETVLRVDE